MRVPLLALAALVVAACSDSTSPAADVAAPSTSSPITTTASIAAPASLFTSYSTSSAHWPHITTMMTDFYYSWTSTERAWAGAHYDHAMSGSLSAWKSVNPTVGHLRYALLWTVIVPSTTRGDLVSSYYPDMRAWFATHTRYKLENAFVHAVDKPRDYSGRVTFSIWGSRRWALNPSDAGARAYSADRMRRVAAGENGVFIDESSSGDIGAHIGATREYPTGANYKSAYTILIGAVKQALGTKTVMLNTAEYTGSVDRGYVLAAGATHMEWINNFMQSGMPDRWRWITSLNESGVFVDMVTRFSTPQVNAMSTFYPRGNSATSAQRAKMWELASYYLVVPSNPRLLALQLENSWSVPYSQLWLRAQEANIGHPRSARVAARSGTDGAGNGYVLYTRDFDRALIVLRLQQGWNSHTYGDATALTFPLPTGQSWIPLNADGTVGAPVTSVRLRNSEAAILLKGSTMR
jgi:hypothetical protein